MSQKMEKKSSMSYEQNNIEITGDITSFTSAISLLFVAPRNSVPILNILFQSFLFQNLSCGICGCNMQRPHHLVCIMVHIYFLYYIIFTIYFIRILKDCNHLAAIGRLTLFFHNRLQATIIAAQLKQLRSISKIYCRV